MIVQLWGGGAVSWAPPENAFPPASYPLLPPQLVEEAERIRVREYSNYNKIDKLKILAVLLFIRCIIGLF